MRRFLLSFVLEFFYSLYICSCKDAFVINGLYTALLEGNECVVFVINLINAIGTFASDIPIISCKIALLTLCVHNGIWDSKTKYIRFAERKIIVQITN